MLKEGFLKINESLLIITGKNDRFTLVVTNESGYERKYILNDTATEIIKYIGTNIPLSVAISQLHEKYGTTEEEIYNQMVEFIDVLESEYGVYVDLVRDYQEGGKVKIQHIDEIYPIGAFIELTDSCNLKCLHCYGGCDNQHTNYMSVENFKKIADQLDYLNVISLELSGGEITLHPNLIEIIEYALSLNFSKIGLLTNGMVLKNDFLDLLYANKERINIQIDLHGITDEYLEWFMGEKHLLKHLMKNIKKVAKCVPNLRVATIVTRRNLIQLEKIADWLHECAVRWYGLSLVVPMGRALESGNEDLFLTSDELCIFYDIIERINIKYPDFISVMDENPERKNCGCLTNCMAIQSNGEIKFCSMDTGECLSSTIGNVLKESLDIIYKQHESFINALMNTKAPHPNAKDCYDCDYLPFCSRCLLRAFTMAKRLGDKCKWFDVISLDVKKYIM